MSRTLSSIVFLTIAVALVSLAHYYLWLRLVRDPAWPAPLRSIGTVLIAALGFALPVAVILARVLDGSARPLVWLAFVWMGLMFILFTVLAAGDLLRGSGWAGRRLVARASAAAPTEAAADPARRVFFARVWAGAALVTSAGASAYGLRRALGVPAVEYVKVELARLPAALAGTRIVQLTDLHIGPTLGADWLERVVAETNVLVPDVIAITGDLVDGSVLALRDAVAPLARLRARWGVYFVTGNHEYYSGVAGWLRELERLGIRVLRNERVTVGQAESSFELAGIDDASAHRFGRGHGADLAAAVAGCDPARELVLLAHQPRAIHEAASCGVGLQLSGHTHGGQIWPWTYAVYLAQPFVAGLGRKGDTQIYVSRGTGFWGPPMRVGAPPEISCIELYPRVPLNTASTAT